MTERIEKSRSRSGYSSLMTGRSFKQRRIAGSMSGIAQRGTLSTLLRNCRISLAPLNGLTRTSRGSGTLYRAIWNWPLSGRLSSIRMPAHRSPHRRHTHAGLPVPLTETDMEVSREHWNGSSTNWTNSRKALSIWQWRTEAPSIEDPVMRCRDAVIGPASDELRKCPGKETGRTACMAPGADLRHIHILRSRA